MKIRPYNDSDQASIFKIYNASKLDELINEAQTFTLLALEQDAKRQAALMAADIYVMEDDGHAHKTVVGYIATHKNEIVGFNVLSQYRGKGLGKQLLQHALNWLQGDVHLQVVNSNSATKHLYAGFGFIKTEEYWVNYNGLDVLVDKMILSGHRVNDACFIQ